MKKMFVILWSLAMTTTSVQSCMSGKKLTSTVVSSITTSVLDYLLNLLGGTALKGLLNGVNGNTPLSSFINNSISENVLKGLVATKFQIPLDKVNGSYGSFKNLNDIAGFIAQNSNPSVLKSLGILQ